MKIAHIVIYRRRDAEPGHYAYGVAGVRSHPVYEGRYMEIQEAQNRSLRDCLIYSNGLSHALSLGGFAVDTHWEPGLEDPAVLSSDDDSVLVIRGRSIDGTVYRAGSSSWASSLGFARVYYTRQEADIVQQRLIDENKGLDADSIVGQLTVIDTTQAKISEAYEKEMAEAEAYMAAHPEEFAD